MTEMTAPPSPSPTPAEPGVGAAWREAFGLYRRHASALLLTCALALVPAAFIKAVVMARLYRPVEQKADETLKRVRPAADKAMEAFNAYGKAIESGEIDVRALDALERAQTDSRSVLEQELGRAKEWFGAEVTTIAWRVGITLLVMLLVYGLVLPLVAGAVTLLALDRALGGAATPTWAWEQMARRAGALFGALFLADVFVVVGLLLFVFPGVMAWVLFAFVAPVVLLEGRRGASALKRSSELVVTDWVRVVIVVVSLAAFDFVAHALARAILPAGSTFAATFLGDLVNLMVLPLPILGTVVLYRDARRRRENLDDAALRAQLPARVAVKGSARLR